MAIMDKSDVLQKGLYAFYYTKSIQRNYQFKIDILDTKPKAGNVMPLIEDYHVIDVSFPSFVFAKELFYIGQLPKAFPVYRGETFEFMITFEEDENSTIQTFINYLQRKIINEDGLYAPPNESKSLMIDIIIKNTYGTTNIAYRFKNCFFLKADDTKLDYKSSDSIKYNITFNADSFEIAVPGQGNGVETQQEKISLNLPEVKFESASIDTTTTPRPTTGPRDTLGRPIPQISAR